MKERTTIKCTALASPFTQKKPIVVFIKRSLSYVNKAIAEINPCKLAVSMRLQITGMNNQAIACLISYHYLTVNSMLNVPLVDVNNVGPTGLSQRAGYSLNQCKLRLRLPQTIEEISCFFHQSNKLLDDVLVFFLEFLLFRHFDCSLPAFYTIQLSPRSKTTISFAAVRFYSHAGNQH